MVSGSFLRGQPPLTYLRETARTQETFPLDKLGKKVTVTVVEVEPLK